MSNTITTHTIMNGRRNLILQFNIVADGSGDYSAAELFDVTDYTDDGASPVPNNFKVMKLSGRNGVGTSFKLLFGSGAENNRLFFESTADDEFFEDWSDIGGLSTLLASTDMSVRITTAGFEVAADTISLTIWIKKKYQIQGS